MERARLSKILEEISGVESKDGAFVCEEEHLASIYLGARGAATVLSELVKLTLHDDYLEAETKSNSVHCVLYEPIIGLTIRRPPKESGRTGF